MTTLRFKISEQVIIKKTILSQIVFPGKKNALNVRTIIRIQNIFQKFIK